MSNKSVKKTTSQPAQTSQTNQQKTPQEILKELGTAADNAANESLKIQKEMAELQVKLLAAQQKQISTLQQYTNAERQYMNLIIQQQKKQIDGLAPSQTLAPIEEVADNEAVVEEMN
jgi:hypothetical protein